MIISMFLAIVDADAVDLDLRISQPNVQDPKRDNTLAGLQPTCDSPETSKTMTSQVNFTWLLIHNFLLPVAKKVSRKKES